MPRLQQWEEDDREYSRYEATCTHGYSLGECQKCDDEDDMDIDKCLNCGRYKASSQLNDDQVCKRGCRNPVEY